MLLPDGTATASVEAYDPYGLDLEFEWSIEGEGWDVEYDQSDDEVADVVAPDEIEARATLTVVATDSEGETGEGSVEVATVDQTDPDITELTVTENPVAPNDTAAVNLDVTHELGFELEYDWNVDDDDWTVSGEGTTVQLIPPREPEADVLLDVTVTDDYGGEDDAFTHVDTRTNQDPEADALEVDESVLEPGESTQVSVEASDPFDFPLTYGWSLDTDDEDWTIAAGQGTNAIELVAPDETNSDVDVTVEVTDDHNGSTEQTATIETIENEPPEIVSVWVDDSGPYDKGESFGINVDAYDPDGPYVEYEWTTAGDWEIDNREVASTTATAPDETEDEPIIITVTDEWGDTATGSLDVRTWDYEPAPIGFTDRTDVRPNTWIESEAVEVTDFEEPLTATCTGCEVRRNAGDWAEEVDEFEPGDDIQIRLMSPTYDETTTARVQLGDTESDEWTVETRSWEGERVFTTCGLEEGPTGPSQSECEDTYDGPLAEEVDLDDGIQEWRVPADGTYHIEALGAGSSSVRGAMANGEIELEANTTLRILVGQNSTSFSAGHGGTFVADADGPTPIVVAGGAGEGQQSGRASENGGDGIETNCDLGQQTDGGTDGDGGEDDDDSSAGDPGDNEGGGGGGFYTGGQGDAVYSGEAFVDGGEGAGSGGFGGGADGNDTTHHWFFRDGSEGGGGYSGGGGSWAALHQDNDCYPDAQGGGGGSYVSSSMDDATKAGNFNTEPGQVTIDLVELD